MVLVKAGRNALLEPLAAACGIIERRATLPILANVLIERKAGTLSFLATDIEIQITARASAELSGEPSAVTVGARKLLDILRTLPEEAEVTLQQQNSRLQVKSGRSRFTLQTLAPEDFPRLAPPAGEVVRLALAQKELKRLIGLVQYAMAQQDIRYYLNGMLLAVGEGELRLVATDGHRLAYAAAPLSVPLARQEAILPRKTVLELARLLADDEREVHLALSQTQAAFSFGDIELVSKLIDGKFPDYTRVIPTANRNRLAVAREPLRQALARAAILSNEKLRGVRLVLTDGSLKVVSSNTDQEEAEETLEVDYAGDALDIGFNVNYLLDVLNNVAASEVRCAFSDAASSALVEFPEEPAFRYVVMPMRI